MPRPTRKLIFGCGYLGRRVAERWRAAGHEVHVVTRSRQRADQFARDGYVPHVADVTQRHTLANLPAAETLLYAVGYDRASTASIEQVYAEGLRSALDALLSNSDHRDVQRIIYVSTTGVYGDAAGDWVDEETPARPARAGGKASLAAEHVLRGHTLSEHGIVLRMAGLYGPGRVPNQQAIVAGQPIGVPSQGWLNLIHIDDAAAVVEAVDKQVAPPRLYNVSDGSPCQRHEYYEYLADLLGAPAPTFADPPADAPAAARAAANKRISSRRLMSELPLELRFPSYRAGLAAIVAKR